ncbi:MAG: DNA ligase [Oscillospiraceae bacterium]|nr:DNA ligase [Oscillospiraceae bacterium]
MSKMSEISLCIEELRTAAAAIISVADWLAEQFSESEMEELPTPPKPALTLEQVRATLATKSRAGHAAEIRTLLQKYGAEKLSQIDPVNYEALMRDAEVLDDAT